MDVRELIPEHKSDFERIEKLKNRDIESIRPIIPELMQWLQDSNWPIAFDVREILLPFNKDLLPHIRYVLNTSDGEWKYFLLTDFVSQLPKETIAELEHELIQITSNPSESDKYSEVDEAAQHILNSLYG
ncbi:DUF5071 domain-containing protein [Bacillus sp. FJAT-26390]|uniref:DUF5071 domain-containing protein n=1 Tax=Bacillus sp. FJAT-26390 TaxID=1743142 RepID=UPI0008080FB0|nr:DUF5071 domain-containing protein [Bacillus sp. FJAT-26390]OBZ12952.1 hypothetical protein A7975_08610 [Bacillus sp. FJAT-26390]